MKMFQYTQNREKVQRTPMSPTHSPNSNQHCANCALPMPPDFTAIWSILNQNISLVNITLCIINNKRFVPPSFLLLSRIKVLVQVLTAKLWI